VAARADGCRDGVHGAGDPRDFHRDRGCNLRIGDVGALPGVLAGEPSFAEQSPDPIEGG
jgi:hypothetical protein